MGLYEAEFLGQAKPVRKPKVVKEKPMEIPPSVPDSVTPVKPKRKRAPPKPKVEVVPDIVEVKEVKEVKEKKKRVKKAPSETSVGKEVEQALQETTPPPSSVSGLSDIPIKKEKKSKKIVIHKGVETSEEPPLWFKTW